MANGTIETLMSPGVFAAFLQRGEQIVRGGLQLRHLAARRHRAGVVEHEREIELLDAPDHLGGGGDVRSALPEHAQNMVLTVRCRSA